MRRVQTCLVILLMLCGVIRLESQTTSGSIWGNVTDSSGAAMTDVDVRVTSTATGAVRQTQTHAGAYQFAGLPPAGYTVTVERPGFRSVTRTEIVLPIQGRIRVDFEMPVGDRSDSITVTGGAPLVQPTEHVLQTVIENRRVRDLPLKSRDFLDLTLLAPGVVLDQSSVRTAATDSISFFGMEEAYKTVWLQGVDFNDEATTGGTNISPATRTRLGLDAVQEFQVMTTGYSPEFGRSGAGAINVILKSGGNRIQGTAFYFLRDDSFDKPAFQITNGIASPGKNVPPFKREQYGGTFGGPIVRDRAFYFASIERQTTRDSAQVVIPDAVRTFVEGLGMGYDTRSSVPRNREQVNAVAKLDFKLNRAHSLAVSYLYDDDNDLFKNVGGSVAADRGFKDLNSSYFATASLTSLLGSKAVNELRLNRSIQRLLRTPATERFLPTLDFPSVDLGTDGAASPQGRVQRNWILANTTSYQLGKHTIKWGGEVNLVRAPQITNENFSGSYRFPRDSAPFAPDRYTAGFNLQFARGDSPDPMFTRIQRDLNMFALFANDSWNVLPHLTVNLGLRYDRRVLRGDLGGPDAFSLPGYSRERPEEVWTNVALGPAGAIGVDFWRPVPDDTLDLSPRIGLTWDMFGTGRATLRASYGIFHDRITTLSLRSAVNGYNGLNVQSVEVANPTFFPQVPDAASLPAAAVNVGNVPSPEANTPYTQQSSAGFEYAFSSNIAISADFVHMLGLNYQMIRNVNAPLPLAVTGGARVCPLHEALQAKGLPGCFQMQMMNDQSDRIHLNAVALKVERRFANRFGFTAGYTLGSVKTWSTGAFGNLPTDAYEKFRELDFGPSDNDVRHRFTGNIVYELPLGLKASAIVTASSAGPYNHTTGIDNNLDFVINDRPEGERFNSLRGTPFFNTDLRVTKKFVFDDERNVEVLWEMFNVFNRANLSDYNGNERASTFRQARAALPPFQGQLGIRLNF